MPTSHDQLDDNGNQTGFWLEELAAPYIAIDSKLITGQNPASSEPLAEKMLELLSE